MSRRRQGARDSRRSPGGAVAAPFLPTQLSGCVLWLRADLGITLNGSNVSAWADQSGAGNNATQSTGANQPPYSSNGGVNGLPKLVPAGTHFMGGSFASGVSNHTLFAVIRYQSPQANQCAICGVVANGAANTGFAQFSEQSSLHVVGRESSGDGSASADAFTTDLSTLGSVGIYSTAGDNAGANVDLQINGIGKASLSGVTPVGPATKYFLFEINSAGAYPLNGDAYEFIVYNRVLLTAERQTVTRSLGARYSVVVP